MFRNLFSSILATSMLLSLSTAALATDAQIDLSPDFLLTDINAASDFTIVDGAITGYLGTGGAVQVPSHINDQAVNHINFFAFRNQTDITSVTIPDTVTDIWDQSFYGCTSLSSVTLPNSVTGIWKSAFYGCTSLKAIYIPSSVTWIGTDAFTNTGVTIYGESGSFAESYCQRYSIPFVSQQGMYDPSTPPSGSYIYADWASDQVATATQNNLIVNSLGLDFTQNITRYQIANLLVSMIEQYTGSTLAAAPSTTFSDTVNITILKAFQAGIIFGRDNGNFDPYATATRQEMAVMVYNAIQTMENYSNTTLVDHSQPELSGYPDFAQSDSWARSAITVLVSNGLMRGDEHSNLTPKSNISIQECLVLNNNLFALS